MDSRLVFLRPLGLRLAVTSKVRKPRVADPDSGQEKQPVIITVT